MVDELAHTNAEGSRHVKRYQDVEELLRAGIHVYTTVNVQHLESLNDVVSSITGVTVSERIPDSLFDAADQVELVDIEPAELLERLEEGKIYREKQARQALDHFFSRKTWLPCGKSPCDAPPTGWAAPPLPLWRAVPKAVSTS